MPKDVEETLFEAKQEAKMLRFERRLSNEKLMHLEDEKKETKAKLKVEKRRAKLVESDMKMTLAETKAEKKGMSKALKKLEREREEMAQHIALLEEEQSHRNQEHQFFRAEAETVTSGGMHPPIGFVDIDETPMDASTMADSFMDDDSNPAGWLGGEISRRSEHNNISMQKRESHASSKSKEDQRVMQYTAVDTPHEREKTKRSKSAERLINSDRRDAPSVARSRSSERMMLSQSSHQTYAPERKIPSRTKSDMLARSEHRQANHVSRRSPERRVARTKSYGCERSVSGSSHRSSEKKLERKKSSEKLSRMEPERGLSRSNSERRTNRVAPAERVVKRTHSGDKLKRVDRIRSPERQAARTESDGGVITLSKSSHRSSEKKLERKKSSENLSRMEP
jgi:hypothetical protein